MFSNICIYPTIYILGIKSYINFLYFNLYRRESYYSDTETLIFWSKKYNEIQWI